MIVFNAAVRLIAMVFLVFHVNSVAAQNVTPLQLQFVDENDQAITGVELKLGSFVYAHNTGLSLALNDLKTVDGRPVQVDSEGKVVVAIPDMQLGELARFKLNAKHSEYAEFNEWINVEVNKLNKITLPRGVRVAVTAIDADTGEKVVGNLYAIAEQKDLDQMIDWRSNGKGLLLSRPLRDVDKRIRLVELVGREATRFSDPVDIRAEVIRSTIESDVPMKRSLHFSGRLHADVARPVRNGMISVCITWPTEAELQATGPVGHWLSHAPIAEDGSFRLTGLPSGDWIQVIASCHGWYSEPAKAEDRNSVCPAENKWLNIEESILPSVFEFNSSFDDVVLRMLPTVSASFRFVDEMKEPLANAKIDVQRSQRFFHATWDSREFRSERFTADELIAAREGRTYQRKSGTLLTASTNEQGIACLDGIPGSKFMVRLEGRLFDKNRIWKSIDLSNHKEGPIEIGVSKRN